MDPQAPTGPEHADGEPRPERGGRRVQSISCGRCGWPSSCVVQDGMRVLSFVCHWCGKTTVGVVDPTIKRNVIF
jgi:hypothetical protein